MQITAQLACDDEIWNVLEPALAATLARGCRMVRLRRKAYEYASSCTIEQLDVELTDGNCLPLIFKNLSSNALLPDARRVRPHFLYDPLREIQLYQQLFSKMPLGTAECYAVKVDLQKGIFWLFLERLDGRELYRVGEFEVWEAAARWLAKFHGCASMHAENMNELRLLHWNQAQYDQCLRWARDSLFQSSSRNKMHKRLERILYIYERSVQRLLDQPRCLIHGEFFASNVLAGNDEAGTRICPIDWETAAWGPGMMDLAALAAGDWNADSREAMLLAYWEALDKSRAEDWGSISRLREAFHDCRFHLAVRMLGQLPNWEPPREHQHNWLADAERLADEVEDRC